MDPEIEFRVLTPGEIAPLPGAGVADAAAESDPLAVADAVGAPVAPEGSSEPGTRVIPCRTNVNG